MTRAALCLATALLLPACRSAEDPVTSAARLVAADVLPCAPQGYTPHLAEEWQTGGNAYEPIPAALLDELRATSGLPVAGRDVLERRDSTITLMYMMKPRVVRPDSTDYSMRMSAGSKSGSG